MGFFVSSGDYSTAPCAKAELRKLRKFFNGNARELTSHHEVLSNFV